MKSIKFTPFHKCPLERNELSDTTINKVLDIKIKTPAFKPSPKWTATSSPTDRRRHVTAGVAKQANTSSVEEKWVRWGRVTDWPRHWPHMYTWPPCVLAADVWAEWQAAISTTLKSFKKNAHHFCFVEAQAYRQSSRSGHLKKPKIQRHELPSPKGNTDKTQRLEEENVSPFLAAWLLIPLSL